MQNVSQKVKGNIYISHQAIASIVHRTVSETYGVVGLAPKNFAHGLANAIVKDPCLGVDIHYQKKEVSIGVYIIIEYGTRIKTVAKIVADNISYRVQKITGLAVAEVNVHVRGLRISNPD
ncbi:MAG: Asp23/Gls24 family envelope stress response protein [Anaerolineae bacterium]|nr:Asp23/Gls24 family envelope stress response protein [Anaerolineae bacterium]